MLWLKIETAPFDHDLEVAVVEDNGQSIRSFSYAVAFSVAGPSRHRRADSNSPNALARVANEVIRLSWQAFPCQGTPCTTPHKS